MELFISCLSVAGSLAWIGLFLVPFRPWSTRENLDALSSSSTTDLSDVTVLIPARDEATEIGATMQSLNAQGSNLKIILIDDQSKDGTAEIARANSKQNLKILPGTDLPAGWAGKLWALEQGRKHVT